MLDAATRTTSERAESAGAERTELFNLLNLNFLLLMHSELDDHFLPLSSLDSLTSSLLLRSDSVRASFDVEKSPRRTDGARLFCLWETFYCRCIRFVEIDVDNYQGRMTVKDRLSIDVVELQR